MSVQCILKIEIRKNRNSNDLILPLAWLYLTDTSIINFSAIGFSALYIYLLYVFEIRMRKNANSTSRLFSRYSRYYKKFMLFLKHTIQLATWLVSVYLRRLHVIVAIPKLRGIRTIRCLISTAQNSQRTGRLKVMTLIDISLLSRLFLFLHKCRRMSKTIRLFLRKECRSEIDTNE